MNMAMSKTTTLEWLTAARAEARKVYDSISWVDGAWYSIYESDEGGPESALFYQCEIAADGTVYLIADMCDYDRRQGISPQADEALDIITSRSIVVAM